MSIDLESRIAHGNELSRAGKDEEAIAYFRQLYDLYPMIPVSFMSMAEPSTAQAMKPRPSHSTD